MGGSADALERFTADVCISLGASTSIGEEVASHLAGANQAGDDSHGVMRVPTFVGAADRGELVASATPTILSRSGATALCDRQSPVRHYWTRVARDIAGELAHDFGVGTDVRHSGHIGRLGHYVEFLAGLGPVSIVTVGMAGPGVGAMVIPGTPDRFLGANPWAVGVPLREGPPLGVDVVHGGYRRGDSPRRSD